MSLKPGQLMHGEAEAIATIKKLGATYGYGNLIDHLKRAWRDHLIAAGLDPETATSHVGLTD